MEELGLETPLLATTCDLPYLSMTHVDPSGLISPGVVGRDPGEDWIVPLVEPSEDRGTSNHRSLLSPGTWMPMRNALARPLWGHCVKEFLHDLLTKNIKQI